MSYNTNDCHHAEQVNIAAKLLADLNIRIEEMSDYVPESFTWEEHYKFQGKLESLCDNEPLIPLEDARHAIIDSAHGLWNGIEAVDHALTNPNNRMELEDQWLKDHEWTTEALALGYDVSADRFHAAMGFEPTQEEFERMYAEDIDLQNQEIKSLMNMMGLEPQDEEEGPHLSALLSGANNGVRRLTDRMAYTDVDTELLIALQQEGIVRDFEDEEEDDDEYDEYNGYNEYDEVMQDA